MAILQWLPVLGWLVAPVISFFVNKLLSYPRFNLSRKLRELELDIVPSLKMKLEDVTEQRMLREANDERKGSASDLKTLGELANDLRSTLYEAEDVLDLIEYHRIEKKVVGDRHWVLRAIEDRIAYCKQSSFGQKLWQCAQELKEMFRDLGDKLQQCTQDLDLKFWEVVPKLQQYAQNLKEMFRDLALRGTLMQFVQSLNMYIHQGAAGQPPMPDAPAAEFRDDVEQGTAMPLSTPDVAPSNPPSPNTLPNSAGSATESRGDNRQHGSAEEAPMLDAPTNSLSNPPMPNAVPNYAGFATEFRGDNQHGSAQEAPMLDADAATNSLVQIAWDCFGFVFALLWSFCLVVLGLPYRSWEQFGIKNDDDTATDGVLSINMIINLRKRIKNIECIASESKKSPLLNQNSSSSLKDADKQSSSSSTVNNSSAVESSSKQKEIDDVYRSVEKKVKVFGRDKVRKDISEMLHDGPATDAPSSSSSKPYSVIGIYGITGSGKSTLAQYVCDYEKDIGHFDPIMFIHVGKTFSVGDIFHDMVGQITESRPSKDRDLKSLKKELEENLKGKCFLLVLDDLWVNGDNMKECRILLDVLAAGQSGSRVLVTAQNKNAAADLGAHEKMQIPIPDLDEEPYLAMFMHYALEFSQVSSLDHKRYEAIGRKITKKLSGSPIAARTVAARLKSNNSIDFWETTANLDMLNETMGALWWSYKQLGVDIRRCFAYCSIFPKSYKFERDELVRIWIAQGFVNTRSNAAEELEDVGKLYIGELVKFSFLQPQELTVTVHDLLHELAERVSGCEFYRIGLNDLPKDIPRGVHHLCIETNNVAGIVEKILDLGNFRTLIIDEKPYAERVDTMEKNHDFEKVLGCLFLRLRKLRVLIIKLHGHTNKLSVPVSIYQMKHLRYLHFTFIPHLIFFEGITHLILPSTFSKLYRIQAIYTLSSIVSYPEDMGNLICLRHIFGPGPCTIPNIGRLTSLQTLPCFTVKEGQGYELKQLMQLNKLRGALRIEGLDIVGSKEEALKAHLNHKERLRKLILKFGWGKRFGPFGQRKKRFGPLTPFGQREKWFDPDVQAEVLEGLCPPNGLQELCIELYKGSRYPGWMLNRRHSEAPKQLHKLELCGCSQLASIPQGSELFNALRELIIFFCDWDRLPENMEGLVSLQTLAIFLCDKMELLPMLSLQSLKKIKISECKVLSKTCREEGHRNWSKIQHIPEKEIK